MLSNVKCNETESLCLDINGLERREVGGSVTIHCRSSPPQMFMCLKKGLSKEVEVLRKEEKSGKSTILKDFRGRLQLDGIFPNEDIIITNLTSDDTGPYWCMYETIDKKYEEHNTKGNGSVLLVVTGEPHPFMYFLKNHILSIEKINMTVQYNSAINECHMIMQSNSRFHYSYPYMGS